MNELDKAWQEIHGWKKEDRLSKGVAYEISKTGETGYTNSKTYLAKPGVKIIEQ